MKYTHLAQIARVTTRPGRFSLQATQRLPATRSYATSPSNPSHLVRNGLLAAGLLAAAGASYLYPEMLEFGESSGAENESKSKLETLYASCSGKASLITHPFRTVLRGS